MVKSSAPPQSSKKLISSVMSSHTKIVRPVECFTLKATTEFVTRSVDIFSSLTSLENKHQSWVSHNETHKPFEDTPVPEPVQPDPHVFKRPFQPVQSDPYVFKKPFAPLPLKQKAKNKRNMRKWIKYSLEDIPLTSDATNSAVAFKFLRELREKKESMEETDSTGDKVIFCRPIKRKKDLNPCNVDAPSCSMSSNKETSDQVSSSPRESSQKEEGIKLMHLQDDFDDA